MTLKRCKSRVFWERVDVAFLSNEPFVCGEAAPCGRSHAGPENPAPPSKGPALRPLLVFGCRGSPPHLGSLPCLRLWNGDIFLWKEFTPHFLGEFLGPGDNHTAESFQFSLFVCLFYRSALLPQTPQLFLI